MTAAPPITLADFLLARIAEDEAAVGRADPVVLLVAAILVVALPLLLTRGGYPLAWLGIALSPLTFFDFGPVVLADFLLAPAAVMAAWRLLRSPGRPTLPWPVTAVAALIAVESVVRAMVTADVIPMLYGLRLAVIIVALPVIFLGHGGTRRRFDGLLGAFVLGAAINGAFATLDALGVHIASHATGFIGYQYNGGRYPGFALFTNQLGMAAVMAAPLLLHLARRRPAWHVLWLPLVGGILASGSRLAVLGAALGAVAFAICDRRRRVRTLIVLTGAAIGGYFAAQAVGLDVGLTRLFGGSASAIVSDQLRAAQAAQASAQFAAHPFFGVGFQLPTAESTYLEVLRDGGLLVAVPLFLMIAWVAVQCVRTYSPLAAAPAAVLLAWLLQDVQFNGVYDRYLWVPFGAAVAVIAQTRRRLNVANSQIAGVPVSVTAVPERLRM